MTDVTHTHVAAVVDRSGSMQSIKDDTIGGFAAFIERQATQPGTSSVSLFQFDTQFEVVYRDRPIEEVPPLVLEPRGGTALLDAIGQTVADTRTGLARMPEDERPGTVVVVIMTDGEENSSREFTYPVIKDLIETQQQLEGWTFLFMGADQDAIAAASRLGIPAGTALSYGSDKTAQAWDVASRSIGRLKAARQAGMPAPAAAQAAAFTDQERTSTE